MGAYDFAITHFNGTAISGHDDIDSVSFDPGKWPARAGRRRSIDAVVPGGGNRYIRGQQMPEKAELIVTLKATEQSDLDTMAELFNEEDGLVYLRADDGDGTNWRVAVAVEQLNYVAASVWRIILHVPEPLWQANTETTTTGGFANMSGSGATVGINNAGNRNAAPTFELSADTVKTADPADDFTIVRWGMMVNRAPRALVNYPLAVTDNNGDPTGVTDTATLIEDSGVNNLLAAGMSDSQTSLLIDTPGGGGIPTGAGFLFIDSEQIYYATNDGSTATGLIRGVGGTTAAAHSNNAQVNKSSILKDGSDIRVYFDGKEVERWIGGLDTANTRIWINVNLPARVKLTLEADISSSSTDDLIFEEGVAELPPSGVLRCEREMIAYTDRDIAARKVTGVVRGAYYSAGAAHTTDKPAYSNAKHIVLCMGRYGLGAAPEPIERRPAIQLKSSQNNKWRTGDQADDALTVFYDGANPGRSGMFHPDFEVPAGDENDATPLQLSDSSDIAKWKDAAPAHGKLQVGRLSLVLPTGIEAVADAITYDVQHALEMRARMLARAADGQEIELLDSYDELAGLDTAQTLTPAAVLHELTLNAVLAGVFRDKGTTQVELDGLNELFMARFTLDQDTELAGVVLPLWTETGSDDYFFVVRIQDDSGGATPEQGKIVWVSDLLASGGGGSPFQDGVLTTAAGTQELFIHQDGNFILPAGSYWIEIKVTTYTSGSLRFRTTNIAHSVHQRVWFDIGAGLVDGSGEYLSWFPLHPHGGPVQPEAVASALRGNTEVSFDKLILELNDASADPYTPFVDVGFTLATNDYHFIGEIKNNTTGDQLTLDIWTELGDTITITCADKKVTRTETGGWVEAASYGVVSSAAAWVPMQPGSNDYEYAEESLQNTDLTFKHRNSKAA